VSDEYRSDIWRLQAQYNIEGLVQALSARDPGIRRRAAVALRAIFAKQAVEPLRKALEVEDNEDTRQSMQVAIDSLTATDTDLDAAPPPRVPTVEEKRVQRLIDLLKKDDPRQVMYAARELANLKHKLAVEPLMMVFNNSGFPTVVRLAVAEALLKLEGAPAEVALLANLRNPEWETRRKAAAILGQLKSTWAIPPLAKALRDPHPIVRRTARAALVHMDTLEAKRVLAQTPGDTDPMSKSAELSKIQSPSATSRLLRRMEPAEGEGSDKTGPEAATIPVPLMPRDGTSQDNGKTPANVHTMATQPLDPAVVEKAEQHQAEVKNDPQPQKPDETN
jgi:HEAT repeat protein